MGLCLAAVLLACAALHAEDAEDPGRATPSDLEAYGAKPVDPDALETGTRDPDDLPVEPEPPDPDTGPLALPGQDEWEETDDADVAAARAALRQAQARAEQAIGSYRRMIRRNHPRGEARAEIVRERNEALEAVERAKAKLRRIDPSVPADAR